jgi:arylsulfatase A-like enzyme
VTFEPFPKNDPKYFEQLPEFLKTTENRVRWEQRFSTPEKWQESMRRYHTLIYGVDLQIGRMLALLEERGWLENTVILFSGDNGFYLGERGFAGKWFMHEESIRTPLIIRDPRLPQTRGTRRTEMTLNIDFSPTILSLAGLAVPVSANGRDLSPLARGESPAWRTEWFYEHLFEHPKIPRTEGVRGERWKYCRFLESEPLYEELYDLVNDPGEELNLAGSPEHTQQLEQMRQRRIVWIESLQGWRMGQSWREPAPASDQA